MSGDAEYLSKNELLNEIFDNLERDAMEICVNCPVEDDETRRSASGEVRAIRSVRRKLKAILAKTNSRTGAVV